MNYHLCTLLLAHLQFNFRLFLFGDMLLLSEVVAASMVLLVYGINTNHLFLAQKMITALLLHHLLRGAEWLRVAVITIAEAGISIFVNNFVAFLARGTDTRFQLFEMHLFPRTTQQTQHYNSLTAAAAKCYILPRGVLLGQRAHNYDFSKIFSILVSTRFPHSASTSQMGPFLFLNCQSIGW